MRRPDQLLKFILGLYPKSFRASFEDDVLATYRRWAEEDPRVARRMLLDLACSAPGCHLDQLRLRRTRSSSARRHATHPPPQEATMLDSLLRDLRFAVRRLRRTPVVTCLAAATLALGIGGTTAIFSMIYGVVLKPVSAPDAGHLVQLSEISPNGDEIWLSHDNYRDYEAELESLSGLAVGRPQSVAVTGGGEAPERIRGLFVSSSFFDVLGEPPVLGRAIAAGEDAPGGDRTAVISHGFWQRRWGADDGVLGQTVKFNNEDHVIVGVMSPDFRFPIDRTEAWISLHTMPDPLTREIRSLFAIGRLAEGVSFEEAAEEVSVLASQLAAQYPEANDEITARLTPLTEAFSSSRTRELFTVLVSAVAMVLLIGCANVANLQLAQATGRIREMAIRTAVGAGRGRLQTQLLIENVMLAAAGGVLGLGVTYGAVRLLEIHGPGWIQGRYSVEPNPTVLLFALSVVLVTGVVFGLAPARRAARVDLVEGLTEGTPRGGHGRSAGRLRAALVVAQTALAVMLLIGAGLLIRSMDNLSHVDVGFDADNLLQVQFRLPANKYQTDEQVSIFFDRMIERVGAVPGVRGVATAFGMPFTGDEWRTTIVAEGVDPSTELPQIRTNFVSRDYFQVMGIPLKAGRGFESGDTAGSVPAAVVSEGALKRIWPDAEPRSTVGRAFGIQEAEGVRLQVVGVVGDIYNRGLRDGIDPMIYVDYRQSPRHFATLAARTDGDPLALAPAVREAIWELDADQPLWEVMSQRQRIAQWTGSDRFMTSLLSLFALVALALAALGIGGVLAYQVMLRRHEVGVRMSLGATRGQIVRLVMGQGLGMVVLGLALGLVGAVALRGALSSFLFGIAGLDPAVFLLTPVLLGAVAILAILGPAWRAAWLDPVRTLRDQ